MLMEVVDLCVSVNFKNGNKTYADKKDFVLKAIENQISYEKARNMHLEKLIEKIDIELIVNQYNKNREKVKNSKKLLSIVKPSGGNSRKNA
jgi:hypothetical protein